MNQLPLLLKQARTRADLGIERTASKATRIDPKWIHDALEGVRKFADTVMGSFTIEQARSLCPPAPTGVDGRAYGHITRRAIALGIIVPTGGYAKAASSNGSPKPLYTKGVTQP